MTTQQSRIESDVLQIIAMLKSDASNWTTLFAQLDRIEADVNGPPPDGGAVTVKFCIPTFTPLKGGPALPGTVSFTDDHVAHVPVQWKDDVGPVHPPSDAAVTISDATIASVSLSADEMDVDISPLADGTATVTIASASLNINDTITVNVGPATATSVSLDAADATFSPLSGATGASGPTGP